ncbi:MAG TPA: hypothetical protein VNI57_13680, partial [Candidatus Saccharimonadales bacterium]|nr:hypothetical protein [Candidatus Saccharimonadales bacterium]
MSSTREPLPVAGERSHRIALAALLAVALAHSWYRAFLIDDACISFRYARNLAEGAGLVFNVGERVEGYTNFLWTLILAAATRLGLDPAPVAEVAGILSSLILLAILYRWGRECGLGRTWALVAPGMLAVNRTYAAWATGGLETRFFTLLLVASAWRLHAEARTMGEAGSDEAPGPSDPTTGFPFSALLLALACLTRPEGLLAAAVAGAGYLIACVRSGRSASWVRFAIWSVLIVVPGAAHVVWRRTYYGEWLPNSFYAKVPGLRLVSGVFYLYEFAWYHVLLAAIAALIFLGVRHREILPRARIAMTSLGAFALPFTALYLLYACLVGGDHFEFRFVDPILPFLYLGMALLSGPRADGDPTGSRPEARPAGEHAVLAVALLVAAGLSSVTGFRDVDRHVSFGGKEHYVSIVSTESESAYFARWAKIGRWLRTHANPAESIAVAPSGAIPYYSGLRTLDMLGINDHEIARLPVQPGLNVGHERWVGIDYVRARGITYYIGSPEIRPERAADRPEGTVEVDLGGFY